ncbi:MAG TPA: monofunctional biosynthetic peptidoglycan transglycosylase [Burkholderiales bacterium]|jgi:monofunctional biosynthetic peptidoglycan transglycosylase|nr:monofunctional biosynthetic peptidoglycan transglycosylase [Burkholderiales bacterium]
MRLLVSLWKMFCYTAGTVVIGLAVYEFWFLAQILYWVEHNPATTRVMDARLEALRQNRRSGALDHKWVDYQGISIHLKRAIIIAEDAKFVDHEGFDWEGIQRAMGKNLRRGKIVAGGSTITQQLAKNLFLSGERSLLRKGQEAILTAMLEAAMDKRRIFEIYLNVAEWGENVFGAEAAARHYFGVDAAVLEPEQAARLAAMLPRPRYYDRNRGSVYLENYSESILEQMPAAQIP